MDRAMRDLPRIFRALLHDPLGPHRRCCFCGSISCETARTFVEKDASITYLDPAQPESFDIHIANTARMMYWRGELSGPETDLIVNAAFARVEARTPMVH